MPQSKAWGSWPSTPATTPLRIRSPGYLSKPLNVCFIFSAKDTCGSPPRWEGPTHPASLAVGDELCWKACLHFVLQAQNMVPNPATSVCGNLDSHLPIDYHTLATFLALAGKIVPLSLNDSCSCFLSRHQAHVDCLIHAS